MPTLLSLRMTPSRCTATRGRALPPAPSAPPALRAPATAMRADMSIWKNGGHFSEHWLSSTGPRKAHPQLERNLGGTTMAEQHCLPLLSIPFVLIVFSLSFGSLSYSFCRTCPLENIFFLSCSRLHLLSLFFLVSMSVSLLLLSLPTVGLLSLTILPLLLFFRLYFKLFFLLFLLSLFFLPFSFP